MSASRWSIEQVLALAPARVGAARPIAVPALWSDTGCDDRAVWGRHAAARAEPYSVIVDHAPPVGDVRTRCTCPSRVSPCKHAIALLVMWARHEVPAGPAPDHVAAWIASRAPSSDASRSRPSAPSSPTGAVPAADPVAGAPAADVAPTRQADDVGVGDDRMRRLVAGLTELERWIDDRVRVGLGDPSIARYATWDDLAARLVDAQAGGLANRVRRIAGHVGSASDWQHHVLAEMGVLHVLARAGRRLGHLDPPWRDGVAAALGLTVRQADVRAQVPETATWAVMGRSDTVEDRIVVRRTWLRALDAGDAHDDTRPDQGWAMLLGFAAHGQALESPVATGAVLTADVHRYPGAVALRALLGPVHAHDEQRVASSAVVPASPSVAAARASVGAMLAVEPWLERAPLCVVAAPTHDRGAWVLADDTGSLDLLDTGDLPTMLAASAGRPITITAEWTPFGIAPLTVHLDDRVVDVGARPHAGVGR